MNVFRKILHGCTTVFIATVMLPAFTGDIFGQKLNVERISISTLIYDEFSPVMYGNGIVFCTDRRTNSLLGYTNENARICKLFYSKINSKNRWETPVLFSRDITTTFNEGPATFNREGTLIYFTRNNITSGKFLNADDSLNLLGIYSAELINGTWQNIRPFLHNNPLYNNATPSLAPDGQRLYFSSDNPDGYGGMDIYYCIKCGADWCKPVNAGSLINTSGNETYPHIDERGRLYFSSDGLPGMGGKDIYYTFEDNGAWIKPVPADSLINSAADDYGIVVDSTGLNGYFTSDRLSSKDIFRFSVLLPEFTKCDTFIEPTFCYTFYDERYVPDDTLILHYRWDFGNGIIKTGPQVDHCFPGAGEYKIMLDITDEITGDTVAWQVEYGVTLDMPEQLYLNSPNVGIKDKVIEFNTHGSVLNGSDIADYSWDFGDGFEPGISGYERKFPYPGKYTVSAGMKNSDSNGCVSKELRILDSVREIWRSEPGNHLLVNLLADNSIPASDISALEKMLNDAQVNIDQQDIHAETSEWLMKLLHAVNASGLHLEIQVYHSNSLLKSIHASDKISFFLKNNIADQDLYGVRAADVKHLLTGKRGSAQCVYEFIIMKK